MNHSIRLHLIGWLKRVADHVAKQLMQELRGSEMHAHPGTDNGDSLVVGVGGASPEGKADDSVPVAHLGNQVHIVDFNALIANQQPLGAYRQCSLSHQEYTLGTVFDFSKLNALALGVESYRRSE